MLVASAIVLCVITFALPDQFWTRADDLGHFTIPSVRPGAYTLHAIATGVLGEFSQTNITKTVIRDDIVSGYDELGVLFVCEDVTFWYGSTLWLWRAGGRFPDGAS